MPLIIDYSPVSIILNSSFEVSIIISGGELGPYLLCRLLMFQIPGLGSILAVILFR